MTDELESIWKEAMVTYTGTYLGVRAHYYELKSRCVGTVRKYHTIETRS
jgi:hypothetical protein